MKKKSIDKKTLIVILISLVIIFGILLILNITKEISIGGERSEEGCLISAGYSWNETLQKCVRQFEINSREYISRHSEICSNIQLNCEKGYEFFHDVTGCGCQLETAYQKKIYCTPKSRNAEFCMEIYMPVCGYKSNNNKQIYPNSCFACINEEVEYWIEGKC